MRTAVAVIFQSEKKTKLSSKQVSVITFISLFSGPIKRSSGKMNAWNSQPVISRDWNWTSTSCSSRGHTPTLRNVWHFTSHTALTTTAEKRVATRLRMLFHFHKISPAFPLIQSCTFFILWCSWLECSNFFSLSKYSDFSTKKRHEITQTEHFAAKQSEEIRKSGRKRTTSLVFEELQWGQRIC